jgi:hypothetical protein
MNSPWGQIDHTHPVTRGVAWVGTPGHGGLRVSRGFAEVHLTPQARAKGIEQGGYYWFEEDCRYAVACWELLWLFPAIVGNALHPPASALQWRNNLYPVISRYDPDYFLARGIEPEPKAYADWLDFNRRLEMREARDPDCITSARGQWFTGRPGTVMVTTADGRAHVVTEESYDALTRWTKLLSECEVVERNVDENVPASKEVAL